MTPTVIFLLQFAMSLFVFALIAAWYVAPWLARLSAAAALSILLLPHAFRHIGMSFMVPNLNNGGLPPGICNQRQLWRLALGVSGNRGAFRFAMEINGRPSVGVGFQHPWNCRSGERLAPSRGNKLLWPHLVHSNILCAGTFGHACDDLCTAIEGSWPQDSLGMRGQVLFQGRQRCCPPNCVLRPRADLEYGLKMLRSARRSYHSLRLHDRRQNEFTLRRLKRPFVAL